MTHRYLFSLTDQHALHLSNRDFDIQKYLIEITEILK